MRDECKYDFSSCDLCKHFPKPNELNIIDKSVCVEGEYNIAKHNDSNRHTFYHFVMFVIMIFPI